MKITLSAKYWASIRLVPKANLAVLAASAILNFRFLRHTLGHIHEEKLKYLGSNSLPSAHVLRKTKWRKVFGRKENANYEPKDDRN